VGNKGTTTLKRTLGKKKTRGGGEVRPRGYTTVVVGTLKENVKRRVGGCGEKTCRQGGEGRWNEGEKKRAINCKRQIN